MNIHKDQDGNYRSGGGDDRSTKFVSGGDGGLVGLVVNADREKSCWKVASIKSPKCTHHPHWPSHATQASQSGLNRPEMQPGHDAAAMPCHWCSWLSFPKWPQSHHSWPVHPSWPANWSSS